MYKRKCKRVKLTADLKINTIRFFYKHGLAATIDSFFETNGCKISRSTIYSWKKEYDMYHDHGRLHTSLAPKSKRPKRVRVSSTDSRIINEIIRLRTEYRTLGKAKLYHMLMSFCEAKGLIMVSESQIGKLITKLKESKAIPTSKANYDVNINGKTGKLEVREIKSKMRKKKTRKPKEEVALGFGDIWQIDAVVYQFGRTKKYFIVCIDLFTRISFAKTYDTLNSTNAKDTLKEFERLYNTIPKAVQTDNGLEYHKYFDEFLSESNIKHYWNYPNSPKMNAFVERMNRTLQEECVDWYLKSLRDLKPSEFNQILNKY
ncbi:MAG: DDE-type integrase/transposase/recombinase, partial [Patescibacteria group bacterium]